MGDESFAQGLSELEASWRAHGSESGHGSCHVLAASIATLLLQFTGTGLVDASGIDAVLRFIAGLGCGDASCPTPANVFGGARGTATLLLRVLQFGTSSFELARPAAVAAVALLRALQAQQPCLAELASAQLASLASTLQRLRQTQLLEGVRLRGVGDGRVSAHAC